MTKPKRIGAGPVPARKKGLGKRRAPVSKKAIKVTAHEGSRDAQAGLLDPSTLAAIIGGE